MRPANYCDRLGCSAGVPTGDFSALRTAPLQKMLSRQFAAIHSWRSAPSVVAEFWMPVSGQSPLESIRPCSSLHERPCLIKKAGKSTASIRKRMSWGNMAFSLKNNSFVAQAARHSLAIQKFQKRNRVLAADSGQLFELRHAEAVALQLMLRKQFAEMFKR